MLPVSLSQTEDIRTLEEKSPLFRKKEAEAGQVKHLLVGFNLGKIGVNGHIYCQVWSQTILKIKA